MSNLLSDRGTIDMGIRKEATLEEAMNDHRQRKRHRRAVLQTIEEELVVFRKSRELMWMM